jgi:hypothetical protein
MRKSLIIALAAAAFAVVPSSAALVGIGAMAAAVSVLAGSDATAATALLPGWVLSCGRDPRCFERGEARRQAARLRALRQARTTPR